MKHARIFLSASVILVVAFGSAFAQAPAPSGPASSKESVAKRVETWTTKQWNAAKKEWARDRAKWADCQNKSKAQKLSGRKSWSFLYQCMTN
jgi:hypothetical protein